MRFGDGLCVDLVNYVGGKAGTGTWIVGDVGQKAVVLIGQIIE